MFRLIRQRRKKKKRTARDDGVNTGDAHLYSSAEDYYASKPTNPNQNQDHRKQNNG